MSLRGGGKCYHRGQRGTVDKCVVRTNERMVNHGNAQDNRVHVYTLWEEGAAEQYDGTTAAGQVSAQAGQSAAYMGRQPYDVRRMGNEGTP